MQLSMLDKEPSHPIHEIINLTFDGETLKSHSFDVEYYAQSLLGFGRSFKFTNKRLLNLDINLLIKSEKRGSFEAIVEFFTQKEVVAGAVLASYLQFFNIDFINIFKLPMLAYKLLIELFKNGKGDKKSIIVEAKKLELPDENINALIFLCQNTNFRTYLDDMTLFLSHLGMESLEIEQPNATTVKINKDERKYFISQPEDEINIEIDEKVVSITYLSPEKNRWQFKSASSEFWADVEDNNFLILMSNKALENIIDLKFTATIEKTSIKEANTRKTKVSRKIFNFKSYTPPTQLELLKS